MDEDEVHLAAAIVVNEADEVLVVRRSRNERFLPGAWGVPCGKLESHEAAHEAVLRELREETGLCGEVLELAGRSEFVSSYRGRWVDNRQSNFLVRPLSSEVRLPERDQEHRWLSTARMGEVVLDRHNLDAIRQGLEVAGLDSSPVRALISARSTEPSMSR